VARSHIQGGKNDAALMPVVRGMRCCFTTWRDSGASPWNTVEKLTF
jgi:hypothetical protein